MDSKQLSEETREALFAEIGACAIVGLGWASVEEIDRLNIRNATFLAMIRAVAALGTLPAAALVDGNALPPDLACPAEAIVDGDVHVPAIAAASIVAKVARDRLMTTLCAEHPGYGFAQHKGYGVPAHLEALRRLGPCPLHRRSFKPVREALGA